MIIILQQALDCQSLKLVLFATKIYTYTVTLALLN